MTQTVYLHIGHGRCGSSSIQTFADKSRDALIERGILYPSEIAMGFPESQAGRGGNAQAVLQGPQEAPAAFEVVGRYLDGRQDERILLSSEFLISADLKFLRPFVKMLQSGDRRVVVIVYLREQREWMISRYAQAIKSKRWTMPLEQYMLDAHGAPGLDYLSILNAWADLAGREQLAIRIFERGRLDGGDARTDLFKLAGVEVGDLIIDDPTANASVSVEELEVARLASAATDLRNFNPRMFFRHTQEVMAENGWKPTRELYRLVSPDVMRMLGEYYEPRNQEFRREYLPDEPDPLFNTKIPEQYAPLSDDERISERSVTLLAGHFARGLNRVRERRAARVAREQLRSEARRAERSKALRAERSEARRAERSEARRAKRSEARRARKRDD